MRNTLQVKILGAQIGQGKFIENAYKLATKKPHGYLCFDFQANTPDEIRFRTDLFSICPTVYTQQQL
jgi:hypothetical protein